MADQVEAGTEQHVVRDVASLLAQDFTPREVDRSVERRCARRGGWETRRDRLWNAVTPRTPLPPLIARIRGNRQLGNALDVSSKARQAAARQLLLNLVKQGAITNF